ncbi:MAG: DUF5926 family protein [Cellulomonadaceae bacterium]|jgi:hypothetical protein|nr:DUF5926 family protein [Cellulomonadaceae bacterium]
MAKHAVDDFVLRPFEGLPSEADWVAMREIVPSALGHAKTVKAHGSKAVSVVTILPGGFAAMHRPDGQILLALQAVPSAGDLSRALAAVLLEALDAEPGTAIPAIPEEDDTPRLQDLLDLSVDFAMEVQQGYDYWLDAGAERTRDVEESLAEAADGTIPTVQLTSVDHAFWCSMNNEFLRWVRTEDEDAVVNAIARLHAKRESALVFDGGEGRFLGMFRAAGLVVPVWQLPPGTEASDVEKPAAALAVKLDKALAVKGDLDANERRARAGIVSRQVTLR